jgi:hypothetical protein
MNEFFLNFFVASKLNPFTVMHERVFLTLFAAMARSVLAPAVHASDGGCGGGWGEVTMSYQSSSGMDRSTK